jgi:hypothetical protein
MTDYRGHAGGPGVVLFAGRPGRVMLLQEAAVRAGVGAQVPLFGRPTCLALPAALAHGVVASTGCIGNRVYTDLGEDELYVAVPGKDLSRNRRRDPDHRRRQRHAGRVPPRAATGTRDRLAPVALLSWLLPRFLSPQGAPPFTAAQGSCGSRRRPVSRQERPRRGLMA